MAKAAVGFPTKSVDESFTLRLQSLSTTDTTLLSDNGKNLTTEQLRIKRVVKKAEEGGGLSDDSSEDESSVPSSGARSPNGYGDDYDGSSKETSGNTSGNPFTDDDNDDDGDLGGASDDDSKDPSSPKPSTNPFDDDQAEKVRTDEDEDCTTLRRR